jgi:hypothetical protein
VTVTWGKCPRFGAKALFNKVAVCNNLPVNQGLSCSPVSGMVYAFLKNNPLIFEHPWHAEGGVAHRIFGKEQKILK